MRIIVSILLFVAILGTSKASLAFEANEQDPFAFFGSSNKEPDPFDLPQIVAVENKKFNPYRDITVQLGILPLDAFYKALSFGISYTQSYTSFIGWEIVNAHIATANDTNLKQELLDKSSLRPAGLLDSVKYYITSQVVYTPIYSKNLLFNRDVVYGEWSFVGGLGMVGYQSGETALMFGGGLESRFFSSNSLSYKFDGRLYYQTAPSKSSDLLLMLNLGLSFEVGNKSQTGRSL